MSLIAAPQESILSLANRLGDAFNGDDMEAVIALFAEDGIYVGFDGRLSRGKAALREAFTPLFRGDYGKVQFHNEDLWIDEATGRVTVRWLCRHEIPDLRAPTRISQLRRAFYRGLYGPKFGWYGMDMIRFEGGLVREKRTYALTARPLARRNPPLP